MTYLKLALRTATAAALVLAAAPSLAQTTTYGSGTAAVSGIYTQNFDTLATGTAGATATGTTLPTGWRAVETGSNADATYRISAGAQTTGDVYSYGSDGSTERALGTLRSGTLLPTIGAVFSNATGSTITSLLFGYTGEQWRNGSTSTDRLDFQFSTTSTNIGDAANSSAWMNIDTLDFVSPTTTTTGALNGNVNTTALTGTASSLSIAIGALFAIRFLDADVISGGQDGLAVDNFSVTALGAPVTPVTPVAGAVPEPATWAMMIVGFGVVGGSLRRRRRPAVAFA